jgi:hypothetical protein
MVGSRKKALGEDTIMEAFGGKSVGDLQDSVAGVVL